MKNEQDILENLRDQVCNRHGLTKEQFVSRRRADATAHIARQEFIRMGMMVGLNLRGIADFIERDRTLVLHSVRRMREQKLLSKMKFIAPVFLLMAAMTGAVIGAINLPHPDRTDRPRPLQGLHGWNISNDEAGKL